MSKPAFTGLFPWASAACRHASTISARIGLSAGVDRLLPEGTQVYEAEPVTVQKSVFVGRACRLDDPSHVPVILAWIMQQKGVAKAAHPIIHAWRCKVNGLEQQGDDDDGETAAGDRLARLLELVEAENVLVVVTRYFGGVKLGPSRFKYISQAARNALDAGGLLKERPDKTSARSSKKRR
ncbi:ribosomal protein S5 domain 2-like protein [Peniophora sp. CONT]|nr:ribosomal protein S5 domain 2-like protein [Peniophora sp. CONT]